ncbi:MAG: hypothetical protein HQL81_07620 [Magnetococcales bacterium]|nr:hypothetical protein [Magnetococcales bacterium]
MIGACAANAEPRDNPWPDEHGNEYRWMEIQMMMWTRLRPTLTLAVAIMMAVVAEAAPPPGHPSVEDASRILAIPESAAMHQGAVLEAFDSNNYTYLRVSHPTDGERWLAAPRQSLTVGTRIRYGEGTRMEQFFSKVWHRTFPVIYFVGPVMVDNP